MLHFLAVSVELELPFDLDDDLRVAMTSDFRRGLKINNLVCRLRLERKRGRYKRKCNCG